MALTRNGRTINQSPGTFRGLGDQYGNTVKGGLRNRFVGGFSPFFGAYANGHIHPSAFVMPQKAGALSSYTEASASLTQTVIVLTPGLPISGSSTLTLTAQPFTIDKIVALIASGALVLSVDQATLAAAVSATANGTLTLTGSAGLGGIFDVMASSSIVLVPNTTLTAQAFMDAAAGGPEPLSPQGLANAVWQRAVDSGYSAEEILRVLAAVAAGKTTIVPGGGGTASVVFRDLGDTKDRITADMVGSERQTVTIDEA